MDSVPEHWTKWLDTGRGRLAPLAVSEAFDTWLCGLPWTLTSIDWGRLPSTRFDYAKSGWNERQELDWARSRPIGDHEWAFLIMSASKPGIVATLEDVITELDWLTMHSTHYAYLAGVDRDHGDMTFRFHDLAEWNGFAVLQAPDRDAVPATGSSTLTVADDF